MLKRRDPKEEMKKQQRELRQTERVLTRDRTQLDRQEKQLELEIRKLAKQGNREACGVLAKQLVNLRKQKTKSYGMSSKITAIGSQAKAMQSNVVVADAMGRTAQTMAQVNKRMNPAQIAATMGEFEKANAHMDMSEEMIADSLDSILNESGDEAEEDAVVQQVLDEIGIEMNQKLAGAGSVPKSAVGASSTATSTKAMTDADVERLLAGLKE